MREFIESKRLGWSPGPAIPRDGRNYDAELPQTTWKPAQKGSRRSTQMVLKPVATAEPSIEGTIALWSPTVVSASTPPMKRLPI